MTINNSTLVDPEELRFSVLSEVELSLFRGYNWQSDDVEHPTARGSTFFAFENPPEESVASITVVNVTNDLSEPHVGLLDESDVAEVDAMLREAVESEMQVVRWMKSHLNALETSKTLVTPYIVELDGKMVQYIAARTLNNGRKYLVVGSFDVVKSAPLATLVVHSMSSLRFTNN